MYAGQTAQWASGRRIIRLLSVSVLLGFPVLLTEGGGTLQAEEDDHTQDPPGHQESFP